MRHNKLLALTLVTALAFTACGKKADTTTPSPAPTETVTEENAEGNVEENVEGTEEEITEEIGEEESGELTSNESLDAAHEAAKEVLGDEYVPSMPYTADMLAEIFGVEADWYDAAIAEGPMMSANIDKFIAIHATEGNLENVQNALNSYRDSVIGDLMQYPMNLLKTQACVVETIGDNVVFVMLGFIDDMAYTEDEEMIEAYKEINNNVIEAIKPILGE